MKAVAEHFHVQLVDFVQLLDIRLGERLKVLDCEIVLGHPRVVGVLPPRRQGAPRLQHRLEVLGLV